ncbi:MAG: ribosomal-processing cysteine protease Prp [Leptospiraceae bacterium]|nr:ribosomal-processing cysteine protease Prp [Leptospiraceae bacterium]MCP5494228.1 ribosomal-processing cysteine protease Prp [Leptospiraceae bacterium]
MIEIKITIDSDKNYHSFLAQGHATSVHGGKGNNILCAAISVLSQTLYIYAKKKSWLTFEKVAHDGFLEMVFNKQSSYEINLAVGMVLEGINNLLKQYPNDIKLVIED